MWSGKHSIFLLLSFILFSVFHAPAFAIKKSYIVYMGSHEHGEGATDADFDRVTQTYHEFVQSYVGSSEKAKEAIIYSYTSTSVALRPCWKRKRRLTLQNIQTLCQFS
ncbi:Subtilisin protease SBT5.4 [Spatholobus suberectus]|nr:Subtilisin protease SBT5.4 [Spatholobus suberectus]